MARSAASSSATERGETPEVAALGNTLTDLFKTLGVSQEAYAVRVDLHASTVSRFLNGRRLATEDFVDRLIRETEQRLGSPLMEEAKAEVHRQRLAALRSTNPAGYELECLRQEMTRSQRTIARLTRQEEALHDLLAKRESEVVSVRGELDSLRRDWSADLTAATRREVELRAALDDQTTVRDALLAEIARLRADLADTSALRADAETRCRDLEDRVLAMEEELAGLHRDGRTPIDVLLRRLEEFRSSGDVRTLGRELADVAWARPAGEIVAVLQWLGDAGERSRAESLLRDSAQSRPLGVVTEIGDVMPAGPFQKAFRSHLVRYAALFRSVPELAALHRHWHGGTWHAPDDVLVCLLQTDRPAAEVLEVISLLSGEGTPVLPSLSAAAGVCRPPDRVVAVLAELAHRGDEHLVRIPLGHLMRNVHAAGLGQPFAADLMMLPEDRRHALWEHMAAAPMRTLLDFLDTLDSSPTTAQAAAELLGRVEATGRGADVRSYRGKRARAYPHHEPEAAADGG
ncbi:helix-turn-helix domain-containing protein [Streptomyces sp. NPDC006487]|uniref:helix-turn-helix domain-containing protein n=1 Tax=Streptomyces sp. NPDC006487 TaxID=3364748 RepID=UPI0036A2C51F